ncbi:MAG TPA: CBS domain-containing protein [Halothiobacillus sp.]|nr:CBS domain-containing protein [Halothiobacillus sp.]
MTQPTQTLLPDEDVHAAMRAMSGYIDITTEDFREIYTLAHEHAVKRLFGQMDVAHLMRRDLSALHPEQTLTAAAEQMALMHAHTLPVIDADGRVLGDVSEWNFLQGYGADTFFFLVFRLMAHDQRFVDYCNRTHVGEVMTRPATALLEDGSFVDIARAFHAVEEKRLPVVDAENRLIGVVLRRDFLQQFHLDDWL